MPYFNSNNVNLLFIHIPKTGGSSLDKYFSEKYAIPLDTKSLWMFLEDNEKERYNIYHSLQHLEYKTIIKNNSFFNINFDNITILTIVRNPYYRIISDLFWFSKINENTSKEETYFIIKKYLEDTLLFCDNHNKPQHFFITTHDCEIIPDIKILHTETLQSDMHNLGYTDFDIKENANSCKVDYLDFLNQDSINLINDFYDMDFKLFNYDKIIL
jgi:hypothetical protein